MWVRFTAQHDHSPVAHGGRVTLRYRAGSVRNVTRACGNEAISAGRAERIAVRTRAEAQALKAHADV